MNRLIDRVLELLDWLWRESWIPALLVRLFVGYFFLETGWGKIHSLDDFAERFAEWGIPAPAFNAALSAWTEVLGGRLIVLGLFTRLVSIPLFINMLVGVLAVQLNNLSALVDCCPVDDPH